MISGRDSPARISVIIASRGRPDYLRRCLRALDHLVWPLVEVVVVTDRPGREAISDASTVKLVAFDRPGLAAARNEGLRVAGGDIVAFIDDDAVAEPMWLAAIAEAFTDAAVGAVTGPVLGRNGISLQSGAETILSDATTVRAGSEQTVRRARSGRAPKTVGTNMAFRAELLRHVGGFDESYEFFLEDADLNMRLGSAGVVTAYAPLAVVHHATAASPRRRKDRAPRDLTDIGRSTQLFLSRHHPPDGRDAALAAARDRETARAIRALQSGALEPGDIRRLMRSFDAGVAEGRAKGDPQLRQFANPPEFEPRPARRARPVVVAGAGRSRAKARAEAAALREEGATVSLFLFSYTGLYHRVRFDDGMWVQAGGLWGRSERDAPLLRPTTGASRLDSEVARIAGSRGLSGDFPLILPPEAKADTVRVSFL